MPRKRKINASTDEELMPPPQMPVPKKHKPTKQSTTSSSSMTNDSIISDITNISTASTQQTQNKCGPLSIIFEKAQQNESLHNKYFKELTNIYEKMENHERFMKYFLKGIRTWMRLDETNPYANVGLEFLAKYLSSLRCEDPDTITHPILKSTFEYLLKTISSATNIRFRICQFVNLLLAAMSSEANIDDEIFEEIMKYMSDRMKDCSPSVRVQAVYALQRLQLPDNPDDSVVRLYSYHLNNDPSALVRQAVLKSIGRNAMTVPIILERLWDVDERVRRRTYLQMSSHPVKSYKVAQRLMLLEQGLNDHSESVRKIVHGVLLPQWLQSYNRQHLSLISALKLDANLEEIQRFAKISKQALFILFKNDSIDSLIEHLPLNESGEFVKCIPFDKLTVEMILYWLSIVEFIQTTQDTNEDEEDQLPYAICELSTFCDYLTKYINYIKETVTDDAESWEVQENQYKLHLLIEILLTFDLGDEVGRQNLNAFVSKVLSTQILGENCVEKLVRCVENLIPDSDSRLQYFVDIIRGIIDPSSLIDVSEPSITILLENIKDSDTRIKVSQLKLRIMELRETENDLSRNKDYGRLEKCTEELNACNEEFLCILNAHTTADSTLASSTTNELNSTVLTSLNAKKVSREWILHALEICFFAVCSRRTNSLTPNMKQLYEDFVQRHMKSQHMEVRDRALKCGIAFSMLYEQLAKDVHEELYQQFVRHHQPRLWTTSVNGICEIYDKYGIDFFTFDTDNEKSDGIKTKKNAKTRQLYNVSCDTDDQDESDKDSKKNEPNVMNLFAHLFDTCREASISMALATGFCRLILGGHYETSEVISKIILKFFNPTTCTEINQILSVFFETLIQRGKQDCLQKALLQTVFTILDAPNESPLCEIKADSVIKFVVNSTMPNGTGTTQNIHSKIADSFLKAMQENVTNKELLKLLSKELQSLEIDESSELRVELKEDAEELLRKTINDSKIEGYIKSFIELLSGKVTKRATTNNEQDDAGSDVESVEENPMESIQTGAADSTINDRNDEQMEENNENNSIVHFTAATENIDPRSNNMTKRNNNDTTTSSIDESCVSSASKTERKGRGNTKNIITPKTGTPNKANQSKLIPDENENCRMVTSTQQQSDDDEIIINTPTASPVPTISNIRKQAKQTTNAKSGTPSKKNSSKTGVNKTKSPALATPERRKRHRLSQAHVRLERLSLGTIERVGHRTRNALVAEFKEQNIMTRNRKSLDKMKSTTQRVEHLKKIAPATATKRNSTNKTPSASPSNSPATRRSSPSSPITNRSINKSSISSPKLTNTITTRPKVTQPTTKQTTLKRTRTNTNTKELNQSTERSTRRLSSTPKAKNTSIASNLSSPSLTPLPKRRSVSNRMSPIPIHLRNQSDSDKSMNDTIESTKARRTAAVAKSKIPTRSASLSKVSSKKTAQSQNSRTNRSLQSTKSMLPLRKGTLRKK